MANRQRRHGKSEPQPQRRLVRNTGGYLVMHNGRALLRRRSRQRERLSALVLSVCLSACCQNAKKCDFLKNVYCRPIGNYLIGLLKEHIGSLKSEMAEIRNLENLNYVIFIAHQHTDARY